MSRHLENLHRMLGELQSRYGSDDEIVLQFKQEVESRQRGASGLQERPAAGLHRRDVASRDPFERSDLQ